MKKNVKIFLTIISSLVCFYSISGVVLADSYGLDATAGQTGLNKTASIPQFTGSIIGTGLSMIGVVFFILMVYGGFLWMTAHGNEDQSKRALDTIIAATIGIIIIMAAYAITSFVFKSVTATEPIPAAAARP